MLYLAPHSAKLNHAITVQRHHFILYDAGSAQQYANELVQIYFRFKTRSIHMRNLLYYFLQPNFLFIVLLQNQIFTLLRLPLCVTGK